jgi:hypothetical protein
MLAGTTRLPRTGIKASYREPLGVALVLLMAKPAMGKTWSTIEGMASQLHDYAKKG